MSELLSRFEAAAKDVKKLTTRPSNDDLLDLYAFYKQATEGDNTGKAPGMFDFKARAKHEAWSKISGMDKEAAMEAYIKVVARLQSA